MAPKEGHGRVDALRHVPQLEPMPMHAENEGSIPKPVGRQPHMGLHWTVIFHSVTNDRSAEGAVRPASRGVPRDRRWCGTRFPGSTLPWFFAPRSTLAWRFLPRERKTRGILPRGRRSRGTPPRQRKTQGTRHVVANHGGGPGIPKARPPPTSFGIDPKRTVCSGTREVKALREERRLKDVVALQETYLSFPAAEDARQLQREGSMAPEELLLCEWVTSWSFGIPLPVEAQSCRTLGSVLVYNEPKNWSIENLYG